MRAVLPILPISMALAIIATYSPLAWSLYNRLYQERAREPGSGQISEKTPTPETHIPEEWTRINLDRPRHVVVHEGKVEKVKARESWRNTIGTIGAAL